MSDENAGSDEWGSNAYVLSKKQENGAPFGAPCVFSL